MRSDMFELLLERPRGYRGCRSRRAPPYPRGTLAQATRRFDDLPVREAMGRGYREKSLNENLAPLARWLRAQVGRPWRLVYAELSAHLSPSSAVKQHVRDHVQDYVATRVFEKHGALFGSSTRGTYRLGLYRRRVQLYVCPRTGLLRDLGAKKTRASAQVRKLDEDRYLVRVDGAWTLVETMLAPPRTTWSGDRVCAFTGLRTRSAAYRERVFGEGLPWAYERVATAKHVPSNERLRELLARSTEVRR